MQMAGISFTSVRESREEAIDMSFVAEDVRKEPDAEITDIIESSSNKIDPPIEHPENVSLMKIEMTGADSDDIVFDQAFQQLLEKKDESLIIQVKQLDYAKAKRDALKSAPPYKTDDPELEPFLKDEPLIQSSHPRIREKTLEVTSDAKSDWEACTAIARWLYEEIKKENRVTIPSALELLNSMKGDCNEHSTLMTAMTRSIGIPAKICAGLVYVGEDAGYTSGFYYHAWNEVWIGGQWYPIDSTLNRIQMDAAHIKLAEGSLDAQIEIAKLIGNLNVKILNIQHNK